jgi:hypothetical protein
MTKVTKTLTEKVMDETLVPFAPEVDSTDYWRREAALEKALQFHKTNGGMMHPMQLVDHATIFLSFLNGEIK